MPPKKKAPTKSEEPVPRRPVPSIFRNKTWQLGEKLGEGACGVVYTCFPLGVDPGYDCVVKVSELGLGTTKKEKQEFARNANTLHYEYNLYNGVLRGIPNIPRIPFNTYGDEDNFRFLVMERLGGCISDLVCNGKKLTPAAISNIGIQILNGLQALHSKKQLYLDVKPDNFMYHSEAEKDRIFFIDFGLISSFVDSRTGQHKDQAPSALVGTPTFVSLAVQEGSNAARRDDVEGLGFVLLSLTMGAVLPWSTAKSAAELLDMKRNCDVMKFAAEQGVPELGPFIMTCRNLDFKEQPPYEELEQLLKKMAKNSGRLSVGGATKSKKRTSTGSSVASNTNGNGKGRDSIGSIATNGTASDGRRSSARSRNSLGSMNSNVIVDLVDEGEDEEEEDGFGIFNDDAALRPPAKRAKGKNTNNVNVLQRAPTIPINRTPLVPANTTPTPVRRGRRSTGSQEDLDQGQGQGVGVGVEVESVEGCELIVQNGLYRGERASLTTTGSLTVGRGDEVHLCLESADYVSWEHLLFEFTARKGRKAASLRVQDLGSTNGSQVNGVTLSANIFKAVKSGDQVTAGDTVIKVRFD